MVIMEFKSFCVAESGECCRMLRILESVVQPSFSLLMETKEVEPDMFMHCLSKFL